MKPTLSIILFTVSAGAGLGLLMLLVAVDGLGAGQTLGAPGRVAVGALALLLLVVGLVASTFHLANPRNAWKAFSRFRTSWLSREAVFAVLLLPVAVAWLARIALRDDGQPVLGLLVFVLALATLFSTSMIYASLKPIRQWHNPLVPPMFVLLGLANGAVLLAAAEAFAGGVDKVTAGATLACLAAAAAVKGIYYRWIARPAGPTIQTATGITRAQVRLLDAGHSHDTFLTKEFGHRLRRLPSSVLRTLVFVLAFALPAVLIVTAMHGPSAIAGVVAVACALAGASLERWLFFVEAQHVVNLYHGSSRT